MKNENGANALALLKARNEHVCFAESLTGGWIAATFVSNSGASAALNESYVTYSPEAKMRILGVNCETVEIDGVVSARCAREMAEGARRASGAEWGVSATGYAGPDGGREGPVGTVFIGVSGRNGTEAFECHFTGDRAEIRRQTVETALKLLTEALRNA